MSQRIFVSYRRGGVRARTYRMSDALKARDGVVMPGAAFVLGFLVYRKTAKDGNPNKAICTTGMILSALLFLASANEYDELSPAYVQQSSLLDLC